MLHPTVRYAQPSSTKSTRVGTGLALPCVYDNNCTEPEDKVGKRDLTIFSGFYAPQTRELISSP